MRKIKLLTLLAALVCAVSIEATPTPQVLWCSGNSTLYFINAELVSAGDTYAGQTVTRVWGEESITNPFASTNWHKNNGGISSDVEAVVIDASFNSVTPTSCRAWFYDFTNLTTITGLNNLNTSAVTDMGEMFGYCSSLASIDLSSFNTANVADMGSLFASCTSLVSFNISNLNTASLVNINSMFFECSALEAVDLSSFYASNVTDMGEMFGYCSSLVTVDLSGINTANVETMGGMFEECSSLTTIYVDRDNWNIGNVTDNMNMFYECYNLVGGSGTEFDEDFDDDENFEYARIDNPAGGEPGYLTEKFAAFAITANQDPQNPGTYYSTFYHSSRDNTLPAGVEAFKASISGDALNLTSVAVAGQSIPAGNAVILKSTVQNYTLTASAPTSSSYSENNLQGTDAALTNPNYGRVYVLSGEDGAVGFYKLASGATIPAHKAYVTLPGGGAGAPKRLRFVFDAATGVDQITNDQSPMTNKVLRDGQLIIIRNGVEYNANGQIVK